MAKTYKVWIEIEEYDEETEDGVTRDAPGASIAEFDSYREAYAFAEQLQTSCTRGTWPWLPRRRPDPAPPQPAPGGPAFNVADPYIEWHVIDRASQRSLTRCDEPDHAFTHPAIVAGTADVVEATVEARISKHRIVTEDTFAEDA